MRKRIIFLIMLLSLFAAIAGKIVYSNPTIWACSNHTPAHVVTNIQDLKTYTQRYGCTGWYVVKP